MSNGSTQRIVVGVDGSTGSRAALRWAVDEARLRNATLEVLLAWDLALWPYYTPVPVPPPEDIEAAARRTLDTLVAEAGGHGLEVESELVQASAASALMTASTEADLLVVGSRGRGWFKGALLGSVSLHCVQHASCPVVVVPSGDGDADES